MLVEDLGKAKLGPKEFFVVRRSLEGLIGIGEIRMEGKGALVKFWK